MKFLSINIMDGLRLELSKELPSWALQNIQSLFRSTDLGREPFFNIRIEPLQFLETHDKEYVYQVDCAYRICDNFLEVKCKYKFSAWTYRLMQVGERNFEMKIRGDFASSWCWPYRTLVPLVRLFMQKCGYYYFHAAGFLKKKDHSAVMLMAPSGTGKTLSTLHYLCNGGKMFHDDTVLWHNGNLYPQMKTLNFWAYRYRKTPEVLPEKLPEFSSADQKRLYLYQFIRHCSLGMVGFSLVLPVKQYWPDCDAPVAPLKKIIALSKGDCLQEDVVNKEALKNGLLGDLEFQNISLLRIREIEELTNCHLLNTKAFFDSYRSVISGILNESDLFHLKVPSIYSRKVFQKIDELIQK